MRISNKYLELKKHEYRISISISHGSLRNDLPPMMNVAKLSCSQLCIHQRSAYAPARWRRCLKGVSQMAALPVSLEVLQACIGGTVS